jgi:hypothetical protein
MNKPCGMLLMAVSKRFANNDMSREVTTASSSVRRNQFYAEERRYEQGGKNPMVHSAVKHQRCRHRRPRAHNLDNHKPAVGKIPPEYAGRVSYRH